MKKGLKALILILAVAIITVIGFIIISKTDLVDSFGTGGSSVSQNDSVSITKIESTDSVTVSVTPTESPDGLSDDGIVSSGSDSQESSVTATATAVPIPEEPESNSNKAQIKTDTSMNGYIYVSYESDKKIKVIMDMGDTREVYDLVSDGEYHRFTLHLGDGTYTVRIAENTDGNSYRVIESVEFECTMISEYFPYLVPNSFVVYDNDMDVIQFGLELTAGLYTDEEKAEAIYDWIVRNISYDFSVVGLLEVGYVPDPQETYETRKGICSDFATLFAAMCRSQGIPCKVVLGYYVNSEYYHAWNEVLINGEYVLVDTSGDSQTGEYNFSRTDGYTKNKEY